MSDHSTPMSSNESVTAAVQAHVAQIVGAAERAAIDLQREVEHETTRRAAAVRLEAEAYLQDTRLRIDAFASARVERITELTDALVSQAGAIQARLDDAIDLEGQLRDLVSALGAAARAAAAEGARPAIRLPGVGPDHPAPPLPEPVDLRPRPSTRRAAALAVDEAAAGIRRAPSRAGRSSSTTEDHPA